MLRLIAAASLSGLLTFSTQDFAAAQEGTGAEGELQAAAAPSGPALLIPAVNSQRGRQLFVGKGCVICHSINGVGGQAAPALDAPADQPYANLFDFVARLLRGAEAMAALQEMDLGYQIELSGEELAHIVAFAYDRAEQARFSEADVPEIMRHLILDEPY
ncbi:MAG: c-type cytochrome [Kiloniellales bacterium]